MPRQRLHVHDRLRRGLGVCGEEYGLPHYLKTMPSPWAAAGGRDRAQRIAKTLEAVSCGTPWTSAPSTEVLIEQSVIGWKEYELEVMRDLERQRGRSSVRLRTFDPMGVHTGDSITVAPVADSDRQGIPGACAMLRSSCIREIGVETGGSNIQFAINPGERPNPGDYRNEPTRVSRSSALASKATGFPIAKIRRQAGNWLYPG